MKLRPLGGCVFVFLTPPSLFFSPLKTFHLHSAPTQLGEGGSVRVKPSKTQIRKESISSVDKTLHVLPHYSALALFCDTARPLHYAGPLPHRASIINQPLLHFSHLSEKTRVLLSTGPPPIIVGHWGSFPSRFFQFFFDLLTITMQMQPSLSCCSSNWGNKQTLSSASLSKAVLWSH